MRTALSPLLLPALALALLPHGQAGATKAAGVPKIEVAFVLDATGSMGPYIREARSQIKEIAKELATGQPAPEVRFALVTYRDRSDDYVTKLEPFSADIDKMKAHLDATHASGGGDHPEAALEGLDTAISKLEWSSDDDNVIKLIYLIGDAPAKHYADGPTEVSVTKTARAKNIVIHSIACGNMAKAGKETWSKVARWTEGRSFKLGNARYAGRSSGLGGAAATGGLERASLAAAVGGSARAYSASVGIDYGAGQLVSAPTLEGTENTLSSGLRGAHVRWIRDPVAWRDLWAAHTSTMPAHSRPALPAVDFTSHAVIVAGGEGAGLSIDDVRIAGEARAASVTPTPERGAISFAIIAVGGAK